MTLVVPRSVDCNRFSHDYIILTRNVTKPRQPKMKMKLGNVQRVEDIARLTCRWVGDFS